MLDIEKMFDDYQVDYTTKGKNTTKNWIEIQCVFCGDPSMHLGINRQSLKYKCWRCGVKGHLQYLIMKFAHCNKQKAIEILDQYNISIIPENLITPPGRELTEMVFPLDTLEYFPEEYTSYLISRGFSRDIIPRYSLRAYKTYGFFAFRIFIPIFLNKKLVNFTTRSIIPNEPRRYINCPNEEAAISLKNLLYNIDRVEDVMVIVEGVTDVWRIGDGAVALFGMEYTHAQISRVIEKNPTHVYVMFDNEHLAQTKAQKFATTLASFIQNVNVIEIEYPDPSEIPQSKIENLRKELGLDV